MTTILHIDASVRRERSLNRKLSKAFVDTWLEQNMHTNVIIRDVGLNPPPFITEQWIGAVFTPEEEMTHEKHEKIKISDTLINELSLADIIVIGTPMYNYGMPAMLKAWFDQIIRINKTFTFDLNRGDYPLEPIMSGKKLVILASKGEFGFSPGGIRENKNHLDPHIQTCAFYLGVNETHIISIEYQEFGGDRHQNSIKEAFNAAHILASKMSQLNRIG